MSLCSLHGHKPDREQPAGFFFGQRSLTDAKPKGKEARAQTQPKPTLLTLEAGKSRSSPSFPMLSVSRLAEISLTTAAAGSPSQAPHPPPHSPSPRSSPGSTRGCASSPPLSLQYLQKIYKLCSFFRARNNPHQTDQHHLILLTLSPPGSFLSCNLDANH